MPLNEEVEKVLLYLDTQPRTLASQTLSLAVLLAEKAAILNFPALISP